MLFNSIDFLLFFPLVVIILWLIPARARQPWLLACSYFFYMCWEARYIILILGSTIITYVSALIMEKAGDQRKKKAVMILCIVLNLGILFFFKYFNFTLESISLITGRAPRYLDILLPVGISFYTFQALGYTIDCYRGVTKPEHNFITYALFVSFFPQLVAGPIERSTNLLGQIKRYDSISRRELIDWEQVRNGLILMCWGMFMKLVIADRIAIVVDNVYDNCNLYGSVGLLMAFFGFGIQIYCDFGSYSIIAIGAARIMGVKLMENFNAPYLASSITDFWRRWHISLSTWFRDYVYIPLGGNRKGKARKLLNVIIVFTLSGLWHGANWTFVFWGLVHGIIQVLETLLRPWLHRWEKKYQIDKSSFGFMMCRAAVVTVIADFAFIFFRADSFARAGDFIYRLINRPDFYLLSSDRIYTYGLDVQEMWILAFALLLLFAVDLIRARKGLTIDKWLSGQFVGFRILFVLLIIMMVIIFGEYGPGFDSKQFIYFQF